MVWREGGELTLNFLKRRFCCLFLIDGFVSNECGLFFFLADAIAALQFLEKKNVRFNKQKNF